MILYIIQSESIYTFYEHLSLIISEEVGSKVKSQKKTHKINIIIARLLQHKRSDLVVLQSSYGTEYHVIPGDKRHLSHNRNGFVVFFYIGSFAL